MADRNFDIEDEGYNPRCLICSDQETEVRHRHYSSLWLRNITSMDGSIRSFCPSCKSRHTAYPYSRHKILVSDSTMHMVFAPPDHSDSAMYPGDTMHMDYLTIPGASIDTLTAAFRKEYCSEQFHLPVDVVLVAGYNDILQGFNRQQISDSFRNFTDTVLETCTNPRQDRNTVAICDFYYPPMLAWFPDDGPLPRNHLGNKLFTLEWLNEVILSINMDNGITEFVRLHKFGIRSGTKRRVNQFGQEHHRQVRAHRFEHWSEADVTRMLHLKNGQRFKIAAAINKYFSLRTAWEFT